MDRGLEQTAPLWPEVRLGFELLHGAAGILNNEEQYTGRAVRCHYFQHLEAIDGKVLEDGPLRQAVDHFLKVTDSYAPGLFHCYDVPDLPRTDNALEQLFGSTRHHERRCTGRKAASPGLVLRGSVRVVAGLGTRRREYNAEELAPQNLEAWRQVRGELEQRRKSRVLRCRFRRDPAAYLRGLEESLLKPVLPV